MVKNGASSHKTNYIDIFPEILNLEGLCWFKSYNDFAEWVDFAYWWSCIGKGLLCSLCSRLVSVHSCFSNLMGKREAKQLIKQIIVHFFKKFNPKKANLRMVSTIILFTVLLIFPMKRAQVSNAV